MGATSVTGVSGPGSVDGIQKGSEHMSLGVGKLIGPRVVAAGTSTVQAGSGATVTFTVTAGVITAVTTTPAAAGTGYPVSSTIYLAVTSGGGTGGIVQATTDGSGTVTAFAATPTFGGTGYSNTTGATTSATGVAYFPELSTADSYVVLATDTNSTVGAANVVGFSAANGWLFVRGTASHVINWAIMKAGF